MPENQGQLVLAQNQYALIQDNTKGTVQVYAGPTNTPIGNNERPVVYDAAKDEYRQVSLSESIRQNPLAPEGHYLVLENPAVDSKSTTKSGANSPVELAVGRKVNIQGPVTFSLWPGQYAKVIAGHHLRSNQYLIARVYNADDAGKNATGLLRATAGLSAVEAFTPGQLLIIKGTEVSFFIPPTGFDVLTDDAAGGGYVREALTLERLEYAILLDEDGNKRYERGPQVVFPEATETFITRAEQDDDGRGGKSRKFKAIELNDYMGLYIKVTADYEEPLTAAGATYRTADDGETPFRVYRTGEELFITGKEQRIYYQRAEHALIGYDDPNGGGFKRERWYGITIPKGEGRYVLDKLVGQIKKVEGPMIFLPDPRFQTVARRVLDSKTVGLWYPGNAEAMAFNASLASQASEDMGYLTYNAVSSDAASRGMNRMTAANIGGDTFKRSKTFTPPPTLTLGAATKYEGVPSIDVWTGYAVQVVDKSGGRRVVVGPATALLEYDETLEVFELSTGKPKTTDTLMRDVYLRIDNNVVSDVIRVETKDLVPANIKVSYRVNFRKEDQAKWFAVENYVKYLCDHMRSLLKADVKRRSVTDLMGDAAGFIRDVVLGTQRYAGQEAGSETKVQRTRIFPENGMEVYDVEVLGVEVADGSVANLLRAAQNQAVNSAITLTMQEQTLALTKRQAELAVAQAEAETKAEVLKAMLARERIDANTKTELAVLEIDISKQARRMEALVEEETANNDIAAAALSRRKAAEDYDLGLDKEQTALFAARMAAITPDLIAALHSVGDKNMQVELVKAIAPLAVVEQQGLGTTMERVFAGTPMERVLTNVKRRAGKADPVGA